jgi:hypothetical protein
MTMSTTPKRPTSRPLSRSGSSRTTVAIKGIDWQTLQVDIDDRDPIISEVVEYSDNGCGTGALETLQREHDHLKKVVIAMLKGCSKKDFRHTVEHFGLKVTTA